MLLLTTGYALRTWFYSLVIGTALLAFSLIGNLSSVFFAVLLIVPAMLLTSPFILVFKWLAKWGVQKSTSPLHFHGLLFAVCLPIWVVIFAFTHNFWLVAAYVAGALGIQVYRIIQSIRNERVKALW